MSVLLERLKQKPDLEDENLFILVNPYIQPLVEGYGIAIFEEALNLLKGYTKLFERFYGIRHPPVFRGGLYEALKNLLPWLDSDVPNDEIERCLFDCLINGRDGGGVIWQSMKRLPYQLAKQGFIDESLLFNKNGEYEPELFEE
jgi:hypothetical protein